MQNLIESAVFHYVPNYILKEFKTKWKQNCKRTARKYEEIS